MEEHCNCIEYSQAKVGEEAPLFTAEAFHEDSVKKISLKNLRGKWTILFFYPADFTFICPTELGELAERYDKVKKLGAAVLSVSTDTVFVHKAWHETSNTVKNVKFPMIADPTGFISRSYGTYIEEEGLALRGTFLIDPDGILRAMEIHDSSIGRSADELIRKLEAAKYVYENGFQKVCPANWRPGKEVLEPGLDLVGKI